MIKTGKTVLCLLIIFSIALTLPVWPAARAQTLDSGMCGENCEWAFDSDGTLMISGSGSMYDLYHYYSEPDSGGLFPWDKYKCSSSPGGPSVKTLVITEGVSDISAGAFSGCVDLSSAQIADSVADVGEFAFSSCVSLKSVALGGAVNIGDEAFSGCESLESFYIAKSVRSIGGGVFGGCPKVRLSIDPSNTYYSLADGVLFSYDGGTLVAYPASAGKYYTVPGSVTCIGKGAFSRCEELCSVKLHDKVSTIRENAFYMCRNLRSAAFVSGSSYVSAGAFAECDSLIAVILPEGVSVIQTGAFAGCDALRAIYIPSSVEVVQDSAFYGCDSLRCIYYGGDMNGWKAIDKNEGSNPCLASVPYCGVSPYSCGDGLTWRLSGDGKLTIEGSGMMYDGASMEYMWKACRDRITSVEIAEGVGDIGEGAFEGCTDIVSASIPESVARIGENAFGDTPLSGGVYYGGDSLQWSGIDIGGGNGPLEAAELHFAKALPDNVCGEDLTWSLSDGGTLTVSGSGDMSGFDGGDAPWAGRRDQIRAVVIESGVTGIGSYVFDGCGNLTSVRLPESVSAMGNNAFSGCASLEVILLPEALRIVPESAFEGCSKLKYIRVSSDLSRVGDRAFFGCGALRRVYYNGSSDNWDSIVIGTQNGPLTGAGLYSGYLIDAGICGDDTLWLLTGDRRMTITGSGEMYDWDRPEDTPWYLYEDFDMSGDLLIEDGVASVGKNAFAGCPAFVRVGIPASLASIKENAFDLSGPVSGVYYEGTRQMYDGIEVGSGNGALTDENVYVRCSAKLAELSFCGTNCTWTLSDDGLLTIGGQGDMDRYSVTDPPPWHEHRSAIRSAVISDGISDIGPYAFYDCAGLKTVSPGGDIAVIGEGAFSGCSVLETVVLPNSVRTIGDRAFENCAGLNTVTYHGSEDEWDGIAVGSGNGALEDADLIFIGQDRISGRCGGDIAWRLSEDGTVLTVTGTGNIPDYSDGRPAPWHRFRDDITEVIIGDGIERIGNCAFYGCGLLRSVTIPESVNSIGENAFGGCGALDEISYLGREEQWKGISVESGNGCLDDTGIRFVQGPEQPLQPEEPSGGTSASDVPGETSGDGEPEHVPGDINGNSDPEHVPGDINGDGTVNNKDLIRLMKYLAGDDVSVMHEALDVNNDRAVNSKDLTRLLKRLAGASVEIF